MKREDFLKRLAVTLGAAAIVPTVAAEVVSDTEPQVKKEDVSLAIDIRTITNMTMGGHRLSPSDILDLYKQTGFLLYIGSQGNAPIMLKGGAKLLDMDKLILK